MGEARHRRRHRRVLALGLALVLAACGSDDKEPAPAPAAADRPAKVIAVLIAAADINPDDGGRPQPIYLRLFELKAVTAFNGADFAALDRDAAKALGGDLKSQQEAMLRPGQAQVVRLAPGPDGRFLGVIAGFRDIGKARWRAVLPIPPKETSVAVVRVERAGISLDPE